jgi:hypothetical protein
MVEGLGHARETPSFDQAQRQWYHWFLATRRGAQAVRDDRRGFAPGC